MSVCRTIAVIADLHYGAAMEGDGHGDIGDILLQRAVARLNDLVHPDVTILVGDILQDGDGPGGAARRARLRDILAGLEGPSVVIPGNRDGAVETFYRDFNYPPDILEVAGMRLLPFIDEERPACCAARPAGALERFRRAREGFGGPIVAVQHVPVFPVNALDCPHNHLDADAIVAAMTAAGVTLSLSGLYYPGHPPLRAGPTWLIAAPPLHRAPFELLVIRLHDDDRVEVTPHALAVDPALGLCDYHVHTEFGYCAQDTAFAAGADMARRFGLAGVGFAEHSGQLYFTSGDYWSGACHGVGVDGITPQTNRMAAYFAAGAVVRAPSVRVGLELDVDLQGRAVLLPGDRSRADYLLGALHRLAALECAAPEVNRVIDEFLWLTDAILAQRVDVLAHPFRIIKRDGIALTPAILEHVADALCRSHTAAEINFHMGGPPVEFVRMCIDRGVKLALAGDAHHLFDIGNFAPHLALLEAAGAPRALDEVLFRLPD